jgi:predicted MPP superfamily phosphohydrolase
MAESLLFALGGVGHLCLIVLLVNIVHGYGWRSHWIEPLTVLGLAIAAVATSALAWIAWTRPAVDWHWSLQLYGTVCLLVGLVGLPLATLGIVRRRLPAGIRGTSRPLDQVTGSPVSNETRSRWIGHGPGAWLLRLPGNEALLPTFEDWEVEVPGLPHGLAGLRILHLTDLHLATCFDRSFFETILEAGDRLDPDLVLLTGDIVEHPEAVDWIEPVLSRVRGRLGQFAILGNHDLRYGESRVREAVGRSAFDDIDGRWVTLTLPDSDRAIAMGGTSAPWGPSLDPAQMPAADLRIVLSHTPDLFYRVASWNAVDLMLCGHNHGGQVRLPLVGPVLMPSRYSRRFDRGFFRRGRTCMYVSHGLGAKHPVRWNCPPEIARLILVPTPAPFRHAPQRLLSVGEPVSAIAESS